MCSLFDAYVRGKCWRMSEGVSSLLVCTLSQMAIHKSIGVLTGLLLNSLVLWQNVHYHNILVHYV